MDRLITVRVDKVFAGKHLEHGWREMIRGLRDLLVFLDILEGWLKNIRLVLTDTVLDKVAGLFLVVVTRLGLVPGLIVSVVLEKIYSGVISKLG